MMKTVSVDKVAANGGVRVSCASALDLGTLRSYDARRPTNRPGAALTAPARHGRRSSYADEA